MKRALVGLAFALTPLLVVAPARADDNADARAEYDAAAAAYDRHDYATAARRFALADEHAPNPRVLQLAMAAALLAPEPALGMNLVERSERRGEGAATSELARKLRAKFERTLARLQPSCAGTARCEATVDGDRVEIERDVWVTAGGHDVRFTGDDRAPTSQRVDVKAGQRRVVTPAALPLVAPSPASTGPARPAETPQGSNSGGVGTLPFWVGVAATSVAVTVSGILTAVVVDRHDDFTARPSARTADAGDAAQDRARAAWVVSGVLAAGTVAIGLGTYW